MGLWNIDAPKEAKIERAITRECLKRQIRKIRHALLHVMVMMCSKFNDYCFKIVEIVWVKSFGDYENRSKCQILRPITLEHSKQQTIKICLALLHFMVNVCRQLDNISSENVEVGSTTTYTMSIGKNGEFQGP